MEEGRKKCNCYCGHAFEAPGVMILVLAGEGTAMYRRKEGGEKGTLMSSREIFLSQAIQIAKVQ